MSEKRRYRGSIADKDEGQWRVLVHDDTHRAHRKRLRVNSIATGCVLRISESVDFEIVELAKGHLRNRKWIAEDVRPLQT